MRNTWVPGTLCFVVQWGQDDLVYLLEFFLLFPCRLFSLLLSSQLSPERPLAYKQFSGKIKQGVKRGRSSVFRVNQRTINIADISTMKIFLLWSQWLYCDIKTHINEASHYTKQILQHSNTITYNAIKTFFNIVSAANLWNHLWQLSKTCTEGNKFPRHI